MRPRAQPSLWKWVLFAREWKIAYLHISLWTGSLFGEKSSQTPVHRLFNIKGWGLNLVLIQRPLGTRKWPIGTAAFECIYLLSMQIFKKFLLLCCGLFASCKKQKWGSETHGALPKTALKNIVAFLTVAYSALRESKFCFILTWHGSLGQTKISARFLSSMLLNASASLTAVALFPSRFIQSTKSSMQHSFVR